MIGCFDKVVANFMEDILFYNLAMKICSIKRNII